METQTHPLLRPADLAARYDKSTSSIYRMRCYHPNQLPPAIKIGNSVRWRLEDVEAWEAQQIKETATI